MTKSSTTTDRLWELLVPTVLNGKPIRSKYHRVWDAMVRTISDGLTVLRPTKGQWVDPTGKVLVEKMIPVRIKCTEEEIIRIADLTASYYEQQAIMYYEISSRVFIRNYKEGKFVGREKSRQD